MWHECGCYRCRLSGWNFGLLFFFPSEEQGQINRDSSLKEGSVALCESKLSNPRDIKVKNMWLKVKRANGSQGCQRCYMGEMKDLHCS